MFVTENKEIALRYMNYHKINPKSILFEIKFQQIPYLKLVHDDKLCLIPPNYLFEVIHIENNNNTTLIKMTYKNIINPQSEYEKRITSDILSTENRKANFYFDAKQTCVTYIFFDTLYKAFQLNKFSEKEAIEDFLIVCNEFSHDEEDFKLLKNDIDTGNITKDVITWYTKVSFLYGLINNSFREDDYVKLFKLRYIINLLNKKLKEIKTEKIWNKN